MADAMETVSDVFNELQVRQNGEDIRQKLRHKALNGGTISRAKLGYLNIRAEQDGRLFNTIGLDEKRAPLVRKAFQLYSSGDYSLDALADTMTDLGLTTRPSARSPRAQPVGTSKLHQLLRDPYYAGWVTVDGQLVTGRHEALITQSLFDRVQTVMEARSARGTRDRVLYHYLKGALLCGRCRRAGRLSRLIYTEAKGRNGQYYGYFLCRGRQGGVCALPHLAAWQVEDAVADTYRTLRLTEDFIQVLGNLVEESLAEHQALTQDLHKRLRKQLLQLEQREQRLIDLAADGVLDRTKIVDRSNAIVLERRRVEISLAGTAAELEVGAERLLQCLALLANPGSMYEEGSDETRRQLNGSFFEAFYLDDYPVAVIETALHAPFDEIQKRRQSLVEMRLRARRRSPTLNEHVGTTARTNQKTRLSRRWPMSFRSVFRVSVSWWSLGDSNP